MNSCSKCPCSLEEVVVTLPGLGVVPYFAIMLSMDSELTAMTDKGQIMSHLEKANGIKMAFVIQLILSVASVVMLTYGAELNTYTWVFCFGGLSIALIYTLFQIMNNRSLLQNWHTASRLKEKASI